MGKDREGLGAAFANGITVGRFAAKTVEQINGCESHLAGQARRVLIKRAFVVG